MNTELDYAMRKELERAGIPFSMLWDSQGAYLAHWFAHRASGKKTSVSEACQAAGFSPDALRQRRRHNAVFAAAERAARTGQPYVASEAPEAVKAVDHGPGEVDFSDSSRANYPLPLVVPPPGAKLKPEGRRRAGVPQWVLTLRFAFGSGSVFLLGALDLLFQVLGVDANIFELDGQRVVVRFGEWQAGGEQG